MLYAIVVNALVAIELEPVLVTESLTKVSRAHVRVAHSWHYCIVTKVKFVILLKFFLHKLLIKDAFPRFHNSIFESKILNCQQTPKQKDHTVLPATEFE